MKKKILKQTKGITLIALVITIIVLLILAAISIATLTGDNGVLTKATQSKENNRAGTVQEQIDLAVSENEIYNYTEGTKNTKESVIAKLQSDGLLTAEEVAELASSDKITIGTKEVDFSKLGTSSAPKVADSKNTKFDTNTELEDNYGNKITVPEGFKIVEGTNVTEGIVIEDVSHTATAGSQFVWIPVGTIYTDEAKTEANAKTITLGRYVFDTNGNINTTLSKTEPQDQLKNSSATSSYYTEGLKDSTTNNTHAKDIEEFVSSANSNGGYYIGRYEARTATQRTAETDALTQITEKPGDYVYNCVTQLQAAERSRNMYTSEEFTSDLVNSYAWDTATLFLQEFDNRTDAVKGNSNYKTAYSRQIRLSSNLKSTGTNNLTEAGNIDKICNVYDMADNCLEWSTETSSNSDYPCVTRGGRYDISSYYTSSRLNFNTTNANDYNSFRPVLYVKKN